MKRIGLNRVFAAMSVVAAAGWARAQFSQTATGIPDPLYTVTFEEHQLPTATFVTTQFQDAGVIFTPEVYYNVIVASFPNIEGKRVGNSAVALLQDPFSAKFTVPRSAAAFALAANTGIVRFTARLKGSDVATATAPAGVQVANNFYGFSDIVFDEISVDQLTSSASFGVVIDNIQLGPQALTCYPDCNAIGGLTIADFGCFQTRFVAGDPYADCNGVGGLTIADFGCFQTAFVAGCP
jgi:hypothetical protein